MKSPFKSKFAKGREFDTVREGEEQRRVGGGVDAVAIGGLVGTYIITVVSEINHWLPLAWNWTILLIGCALTFSYLYTHFFNRGIRIESIEVVWDQGRAPLYTKGGEITYYPLDAPRKSDGSPIFTVTIMANGKPVTIPYDFGILPDVGGTSYIFHLRGINFLVFPVIKIPIFDFETELIEWRNYTVKWENDRTLYINGKFRTPKTHGRIPTFIYNAISQFSNFCRESRVDYALVPKYDYWNMGPMSVNIELTDLIETEAFARKATQERADYAIETGVAHEKALGDEKVKRVGRRPVGVSFIDEEEE